MSKRRTRKKYLIENFTKEEWKEKLNLTKGICPICKMFFGIEKLTLDHIIPISKAKKGTVYTIHDIQPLCAICNAIKGNKVGELNA